MTDSVRKLWIRPPPERSRDVELTGMGMRVKGSPLFLDAQQPTELSFVSHAHADRIARHRQVIATSATVALLEHRVGKVESALPAPYRQKFTLGTLSLELFPAGHVLGSAQVRVTRADRRVLYTGDLDTAAKLTCEPAEVPDCEVLVLDATWGHGRYRFPSRERLYEAMARFVERTLEARLTPVFLGDALGKSQEAMKAMELKRFPLVAHPAVADVCDLYAKFGQPIPHRRWDGTSRPGEVLFFPASLAGSGQLDEIGPRRTAILTGAALEPDAALRFGTDEAIPLSDHADFESLIAFARATGACEIWTVNGFAVELAGALRDRGMNAQPLKAPKQLELF